MKRISAARCGSVPSSRARLSTSVREAPGVPSAPISELVKHPHRQRAPAAGAQIEIEHFGLDLARRRPQRRQQSGAVAGDEIGDLQAAGADLGQILIEPIGERGVEIDNVAFVIDREESGRRVIEIVDGVLQFLKDIFLVRALARHIGQRPDRQPAVAAAVAERPDAKPQPARRPAFGAGDADFFLQALAVSCCFQQPVDRLGRVGVADKGALDRPHVI